MDRRTALAIVGQQIQAQAWEEFVEDNWYESQYGLSEDDWQVALEQPFSTFPNYVTLQDALEVLGGEL